MNNFIEIYDNALSNESCDYIVGCFEKFEDKTHIGRLGGKVNIKKKDSTDLDLLKIEHLIPDFIFKELKTSLKKNLNNYFDKYKLRCPIEYGSPWESFSIYPYSVLAKKYIKNKQGYHIWHADAGQTAPNIFRQLVCMYYLNNVNEGGETEFYHQKLKVKPTRGSLVIFPTFFTHLHKGNVPISNDKYILNFWLMRGIDKRVKDGFIID